MDNPYDIPLMDARQKGKMAGAQQPWRQGQRLTGLNVPPRCTIQWLALSFVTNAVYGFPDRHTSIDCT
jgi:hypothetical protein